MNATELAQFVRCSRAESGVPAHVTDPAAIEEIVAILRAQTPDATQPRTERPGAAPTSPTDPNLSEGIDHGQPTRAG